MASQNGFWSIEIGWKMADDQLLFLALLGLRYVKLAASIFYH